MFKQFVLKLIKGYQKSQPIRRNIFHAILPLDTSCRFTPTCSEYTYQAVEKYGPLKGLFLGTKRIISCNPWGKKGYQPLL